MARSHRLTVNGRAQTVEASDDMPLLWVLRDLLGLRGTKFGCGIAQCRACTVHLDGEPVFSCQVRVADAAGASITTIEGLGHDRAHPLQRAWLAEQVPQCGYCQPGQIMSAAALLARNAAPTDDDIDQAMWGNICRCGTYPRIRRAIHRAARDGDGATPDAPAAADDDTATPDEQTATPDDDTAAPASDTEPGHGDR